MRDLQADKKIWEDAWLNQGYSDCAYIAKTILPHAIERAIKAETNLVDYQRGAVYMTRQIKNLETEVEDSHRLLTEVIKVIRDLNAENAKLREVEQAARAVAGFGSCHDENSCWSLRWLARAVDAYQRWEDEK